MTYLLVGAAAVVIFTFGIATYEIFKNKFKRKRDKP